MDTHKHVPGVKSGDLGPKMGFHGKDNGWLTLDKVRIPRNQMLSKYTKVSREGEFSINGDPKILYATMLSTRVMLIMSMKWSIMVGLLTGLRYSIVRRQFKNISGKK